MDELIWRDLSCWRDRWEVIGEAGDGSQSLTYRVRLADGSDPTPRFLKIPREQKKPERRRRLQREAAALKIFSHHRIPRLVETNAHRHEEIGVFELYLVTEFVEGPTLGAFVAAGQRPGLDVSLDLAERLLDAVEHCHGHDCLHRDIKPPNIILRGGNPAEPMLVDFYLTVGWHDASAPSGGWRDQRDPRFDLTQLARILFFVLTGEFGVPCRDWAGVPPHRRPDRHAALMKLGGPRARRLLEFFDRGFDLAIEDRFQTAEECRVSLCEVRDTGRTDTGMRGPVPLGPRDAALVSAQDVIHLYRQNAAGHAGAIPPDLALALNTLGGRMDALGQQEQPLAAAREPPGVNKRRVGIPPVR